MSQQPHADTRIGLHTLARMVRTMSVTIRGKILLAFFALAALTGMLGFYAVNNVVGAGRLVVETYDKPLMSISYARLALSNFTALEVALTDRVMTQDPARRRELDARMNDLAASVAEDLSVTEGRSLSARAGAAAHATAAAVASWDKLRRELINGVDDQADRETLLASAKAIDDDFDNLVELMAEDGFKFRESALASIARYRSLSIGATLIAVLLGGVIALLLARRMVWPIAVASSAARRIAEGELDVEITIAGNDELGQLLGSMAVMRDNIRGMMDREIAARRSAQTRLVNSLENSAEGVVLADATGHILIANSQVTAFFPTLAGHLTPGAPFPSMLEQALAQPRGELYVDGVRWLHLSRSATSDGGFVVIISDFSAIKERELALSVAKEQAETANRAKTEFLANMGHELRTPLNAVIGFSEIIAGEMIGPVGQPSYKEFANDIMRSGRHLLEMINDILDFAKCEGGSLEIMPEPVEAHSAMTQAAEFFVRDAERGQLSLTVASDDAGLWLMADPLRVRRILHQLVSNAIKFTPAGGRITLSARRDGAGLVAVSVADTGIGMRAEDIPVALSPFSQVDSSLSRRYEGTGMGLPLCKSIIELHGGRLEIASEPGHGTTVTVLLPEAVRKPQIATVASC
ncbi:MAG: MCP four helix bundle domain-containing protein [Alphaproteobacteria bacterium]|nr:MCP four helix bundle domain-containing protein [Alphaproteobacteria bacterium]